MAIGKTIIELPPHEDFVEEDLLVVTSDEVATEEDSQSYKTTLKQIGDTVDALGLGTETLRGHGSVQSSNQDELIFGHYEDGTSVFMGTAVTLTGLPTPETAILNKVLSYAPITYETLENMSNYQGGFDFESPYFSSTTRISPGNQEVLKDRVHYNDTDGCRYDLMGSLRIDGSLSTGIIDSQTGGTVLKGALHTTEDTGSLKVDNLVLSESNIFYGEETWITGASAGIKSTNVRVRVASNPSYTCVIAADQPGSKISFTSDVSIPDNLFPFTASAPMTFSPQGADELVFNNPIRFAGSTPDPTIVLPEASNKGSVIIEAAPGANSVVTQNLEATTAICGSIGKRGVSGESALSFINIDFDGERGYGIDTSSSSAIAYIRLDQQYSTHPFGKGGRWPLLGPDGNTPTVRWNSPGLQFNDQEVLFQDGYKNESYTIRARGAGAYIINTTIITDPNYRIRIGSYNLGVYAYGTLGGWATWSSTFMTRRALRDTFGRDQVSFSSVIYVYDNNNEIYFVPWLYNNTDGSVVTDGVYVTITKT